MADFDNTHVTVRFGDFWRFVERADWGPDKLKTLTAEELQRTAEARRRLQQAINGARTLAKPGQGWDDVYWRHKRLGRPSEEAAFRADEHLRRHGRKRWR